MSPIIVLLTLLNDAWAAPDGGRWNVSAFRRRAADASTHGGSDVVEDRTPVLLQKNLQCGSLQRP